MARWEGALDALARERGRALVAYAFIVCGSRAEAEDLVQDALVKVFARPGALREPHSLEAYVRRTILTTYVDGFRARRRWAAVRHLHATPERDVHGSAQPEALVTEAMRLQEALAVLSPRERACVVLRFHEDMTLAQIAEHLSLATGSVKRYLSDALRKLGSELGPLSEDDPDDLVVLTTAPSRR